jgi:hypothetical protein
LSFEQRLFRSAKSASKIKKLNHEEGRPDFRPPLSFMVLLDMRHKPLLHIPEAALHHASAR